ncbi:MAG: hypothetical protein IPP49_04125 [Saprospiraceae bacterium]|nr:hypothetical protein [Saprospiraceae bacterium]
MVDFSGLTPGILILLRALYTFGQFAIDDIDKWWSSGASLGSALRRAMTL